jgi:ABC-type bacteriocin/lantibiotic exporter with double-glycine peptidase domain
MVTQYLGVHFTQTELASLFENLPEGVPASRITRLQRRGLKVIYAADGELDRLRQSIEQGLPPIIFLQTAALPYWKIDTAHAVVLLGLTDDEVYLDDPAFSESPQVCSLSAFQTAWQEFENRYAVISRA